MPRIHDPFTPNSAGPGSAVGNRSIAKRSRRRKTVSPRLTPQGMVDEEGKSRFDICSQVGCETAQQGVEVFSDNRRTIQARACSIPVPRVSGKTSSLGGSHLESGTTSVSQPHQLMIIPQPHVKSKHRHTLAVDT